MPQPLVLRSGWCWHRWGFSFTPFYIVDGFGNLVQTPLAVLHRWLLEGVDD